KLPPLADEKVAYASRLMLEANHFGSGTGGGVFSLAKGTGLPMLARRLSVRQTDPTDLEQLVTDFVGLVELWTKAFTDVNVGVAATADSEMLGETMRV